MSDIKFDASYKELTKLQFDSIKMDTSLAEKYLKSNQEFHSTECCRNGITEDLVLDSCNNNVYCISKTNNCISKRPLSMTLKMATLAEKLKSNEDLFVQLDYMVRQKPLNEGRIHMDLIVKQFLYWSLYMEDSDYDDHGSFIINANDSVQFFALGITAFGLMYYGTVYINATKQMAAICHLFATLCHEVGLLKIHLRLMEDTDDSINPFVLDESTGCAGIIAERSDLDSALDAFLASTTTSLWGLKHIYVQESVYEEFKTTMKWKCKNNSNDSDNNHDVYNYCGKLFIIDQFNTNHTTNKHIVKVEAYRTTKELLSLMANSKLDYVSLWASDIAEANEIAHRINCDVLWVNDYGTFEGPPEVSNSVYQVAFSKFYHTLDVPKEVRERSKVWQELTTDRRQQIILKSLKNYESGQTKDKNSTELVNVVRSWVKIYGKGLSYVSKNVTCIGVRKSVGMLFINYAFNFIHIGKSLASLACGNTIIINRECYHDYKGLFEVMKEFGAPIFINNEEMFQKETIPINVAHYTANCTDIKVIFMNYGTIFAN